MVVLHGAGQHFLPQKDGAVDLVLLGIALAVPVNPQEVLLQVLVVPITPMVLVRGSVAEEGPT